MKSLLIIICSLLCFHSFAQNKGTIEYTETYNFKIDKADIEVEGVDMEEILSMMPTETKNNTVLYFNDDATLYKSVEVEEATNKDVNDGFIIKMDTPKTYIHYDVKEKETTSAMSFFGRDFIITSDPVESKWKLSNEQKIIQEYLCIKAIKMDSDSNEVVVWFTPQLKMDAAPAGIIDVPGLVLRAELQGGKLIVEANKIDLKSELKEEITPPTKGKKVTKKKFKKIQEQKIKEMKENMGGDGSIMIFSD